VTAPPPTCEERYCAAPASELRSFATRASKLGVSFALCERHDSSIERGATFEIVSQPGDSGWHQDIIISPF
jgi:hypothetical protein